MAKSILVTDDALFMRVMLKTILVGAGYSVTLEAGNGQEALALYRANKPDLVLMDITMPVMDGLTAVKEIKKEFPESKIVMCTAMGQKTMVVDAIRAGAKDFIVKPFQADRVLESVHKVIGDP
ncbi:MAG: response regulator [Capsulimonadaceae bacterium]|nr:response regulator [Capsulimonadaceae bacterium]